jgi:hypothetical protein
MIATSVYVVSSSLAGAVGSFEVPWLRRSRLTSRSVQAEALYFGDVDAVPGRMGAVSPMTGHVIQIELQ